MTLILFLSTLGILGLAVLGLSFALRGGASGCAGCPHQQKGRCDR